MATHIDNINTSTHCIVVGEVHAICLDDLLQNTAVKYYRENPKSKPRWCLRKTAHDVDTCTFLHRNAEKASSFIMVRGEPAPVSIGHLIQNKGLEKVLGTPGTFGEWCDLASPHDIANCKRLHLGCVANDKQVNVEGEDAPIAVSHLLLNRGASYLLAFPDAKGVWCNNKIIHDVIACPYIHRRIDGHPKVVTVEDEKFPVPVSQLIPNKALTFLLDNPQCSGRWCGRITKHDVDDCSYLHRVHPYVRVDGESVRIIALRSNRGLKYLLEHPEAQGHWCRGTHDDEHPMDTCTFIHLRDESRQAAVAAHAQQQQHLSHLAPAHHQQQMGGGNIVGGGRARGGYSTNNNGIGNRNASGNNNNNYGSPFTMNGTSRGGFNNSSPTMMASRGAGGRGSGRGSGRGGARSGAVAPSYTEATNGRNNNNHSNHGSPMMTGGRGADRGTRPPREPSAPLPVKPVVGEVKVAGTPVPAASLVNNAALQYLLNNPHAEGRYCTRIADPRHRSDICYYIHKKL